MEQENFVNFLIGATKNEAAISTLKMEFCKIKIRDGDNWSSSPQSFEKNSVNAVSGHLQSSAGVNDVLGYCRATLPGLGWIESGEKDKYGEKAVKFCKGGMSLNIVASRDAAGVDYYMGVAWTASKGLDAYCPQ
ncbi:TPA: hypothetical protein QDC20_002936 [Burkholderia aenigmatica]|uniref:hypothetical protein n=1 Tax=Burkholderia sp. AU45251 TaxID=3059204 RepID=UPI002655377C|nr:hypothetical protein [Burkholderia sp. AU45251]HDR9487291.1 hypothetical protein [Burkholderia aenigmatica]MDN7519106.1 hypothetical protein [Burkholderia sp. AU45251]HDR9519076.1 hypothetical protein [Burkholderia aenigmatica]HDR9596029.1 hypothetical protein [Burkholderia aenigmatica]HDR9603078.1 hypothetical protein [Burkholderia aenigmatica]